MCMIFKFILKSDERWRTRDREKMCTILIGHDRYATAFVLHFCIEVVDWADIALVMYTILTCRIISDVSFN